MTDAGSPGTEWVPRLGMLEVSRERAELIRGLFELAAFVADHPELSVPDVKARFYAPFGGALADQFERELALVEQLADVLGVGPNHDDDNRPRVETAMGSIEVFAIAYTPRARAEFDAQTSYHSNIVSDLAADGAR